MADAPHSIREALISHSWEWKDDEGGATATSVHASECRRCAADAALDNLEEQLETLRSALEEIYDYANGRGVEAHEQADIARAALNASSPAKEPEPA